MFKPGYSPSFETRQRMSETRKAKLKQMRLTTSFYNHVKVGSVSDCWEWTGKTMPNGYGICVRNIYGTRIAHRISYAINVEDLDPNLEIDHLCRNKICVNPNHLEQVTQKVNNFRRRKTHCIRGHEYAVVGETTTYRPNGSIRSRACNKCKAIYEKLHPRIRNNKIDRKKI